MWKMRASALTYLSTLTFYSLSVLCREIEQTDLLFTGMDDTVTKYFLAEIIFSTRLCLQLTTLLETMELFLETHLGWKRGN